MGLGRVNEEFVFEPNPAYEEDGEGDVEEAFVGDSEDDESWCAGEENDQEAVYVMVIRLEAVGQGHGQGNDWIQVSVVQEAGTKGNLLSTTQPMTWFPSGSPCLACKDSALDRVMNMANTIRPTWIPTSVRLRLLGGMDGFLVEEKSARTKSSNRRYSRPTTTIKPPPTNMSVTFSVFIAGRRVKELMARHDSNHVAASAM